MNRMSDEPCSRKLLLLIEDKPAIATRLGERLAKQADYQMIVASDCLTALKFLSSCTPDLMLVHAACCFSSTWRRPWLLLRFGFGVVLSSRARQGFPVQ